MNRFGHGRRAGAPAMGRGTRALTLTAAMFIALALGALSRATAEPDLLDNAAAGEDPALTAFREGVAAARAGEWPKAHAAFERAHALSPRPVVLFNLAAAQVQTGRLLAAQASYERFLAAPHDPTASGAAERRRAAEVVLKDLVERIPRVRLDPQGLGAEDVVELDGRPLAWPAEAEQRLERGTHRLRVLRRGVAVSAFTFEATEFEARTLTWIARPPRSDPADNSATAPRTLAGAVVSRPSTPPVEPARSMWRSPWLWLTVGAVVVGGAAGVALWNRPPERFVGNAGPGVLVVP